MEINRNFLYHNTEQKPLERRKKTQKAPFQKKSPVNNTIQISAEQFKRFYRKNPGSRVSGIPENETNNRAVRKSDDDGDGSN